MRLQLATVLLLAGTVVGCANNPPPPPPPMAAAPEMPPPPPPPPGPTAGRYMGTADLASDAPTSCRKMGAQQTATVRGNMVMLGGMRGRIGQDGTVTPVGRSGVSGTVSGNTATLTAMRGRCSYTYNLTHS